MLAILITGVVYWNYMSDSRHGVHVLFINIIIASRCAHIMVLIADTEDAFLNDPPSLHINVFSE